MRTQKVLEASFLLALSLLLYACLSATQLRDVANTAYPILVTYDQTIDELIKAGNYYRAYSEIAERNFPTKETGSKRLVVNLVRLDGRSTIDKVLETQEKMGLRPATLKELLTLGESYPELLGKISVVGFGSYKKYYVTTYWRFGANNNDVEETKTLERFFPCLVVDLFGRAVVLIQEDLIPSYNPGAFYGCFVTER